MKIYFEGITFCKQKRLAFSTTVYDTECLSGGRTNEIQCVQMHMLNWFKCFISSLHYRHLNRIYILKFCEFKVCYGNCFWMSCPKGAVEHIVTAMGLLLRTPCALGQHPLRHWYLMSKAVLIDCIHFLLLRSILVTVAKDELSVLVFRVIQSVHIPVVCIFYFSL